LKASSNTTKMTGGLEQSGFVGVRVNSYATGTASAIAPPSPLFLPQSLLPPANPDAASLKSGYQHDTLQVHASAITASPSHQLPFESSCDCLFLIDRQKCPFSFQGRPGVVSFLGFYGPLAPVPMPCRHVRILENEVCTGIPRSLACQFSLDFHSLFMLFTETCLQT
jgi:hypothetical protein